MAKITSSIKKELYKIEITSASGNVVMADEPLAVGGKDLRFSPKELLYAQTSHVFKSLAKRF